VAYRRELQRVERIATRIEEERGQLQQAIVAAYKRGASHREIAKAAGLTRQRVSQILYGITRD
jgi:DNA-directed RNA polymerase specialized sigma subunit